MYIDNSKGLRILAIYVGRGYHAGGVTLTPWRGTKCESAY
jgi:hypothetical protein